MLSANRGSPAIRIGPIMISLVGLVLVVATALAGGRPAADVLAVAWLPALILAIVIAALAVAVGWAFPWPAADPYAAEEEPLLPAPVLPACRRKSPLVALHALEPRSGSSTVAFSLAVGATVQGSEQRRPVALLRAGELTDQLGLDPASVGSYLAAHPVSVDDTLVDLAHRHASGCELLCVGDDDLNGQRLRLMLPVLRRHYDLIVLDCPIDDRWLTDVAVEVSDLTMLIGLPTPSSASQAAAWAERAWERGIEGKLALWLNRVDAHRHFPESVLKEFGHQIRTPEDRVIDEADRQALPWVLRWDSAMRPLVENALEQLLPEPKPEVGSAA